MKKIFSIIAVASMMLTSVFGFTSCQKDELPTQKTNTVNKTNKQGTTSDNVSVVVTSSTSGSQNNSPVDTNALLGKK